VAAALFIANTVPRGLVVRLDARHDGWDAAPADLAAALRRETSA
jgi:hypothetical protein